MNLSGGWLRSLILVFAVVDAVFGAACSPQCTAPSGFDNITGPITLNGISLISNPKGSDFLCFCQGANAPSEVDFIEDSGIINFSDVVAHPPFLISPIQCSNPANLRYELTDGTICSLSDTTSVLYFYVHCEGTGADKKCAFYGVFPKTSTGTLNCGEKTFSYALQAPGDVYASGGSPVYPTIIGISCQGDNTAFNTSCNASTVPRTNDQNCSLSSGTFGVTVGLPAATINFANTISSICSCGGGATVYGNVANAVPTNVATAAAIELGLDQGSCQGANPIFFCSSTDCVNLANGQGNVNLVLVCQTADNCFYIPLLQDDATTFTGNAPFALTRANQQTALQTNDYTQFVHVIGVACTSDGAKTVACPT